MRRGRREQRSTPPPPPHIQQRLRHAMSAAASSSCDIACDLMLVEGHGGTVRAKHERSRLGLVTRLETLVPYQTHQEAWLERSKHWLGSQGRAVDGECTKALFY